MTGSLKTLDDLFYDTLREVFYAEQKIGESLPKLARAVGSRDLKAALTKHRTESQVRLERLKMAFEVIGRPARSKPCEAIDGLMEETATLVARYNGSPALDAGLLAAAQAAAHYEISRYGTLRAWAERLGYAEAADLFLATLEEEEATDKMLSGLATVINVEAEPVNVC